MPKVPSRPRNLLGAPFRASLAIGSGSITHNQLRGSSWRRVFRDIYVDATVRDSHLLRIASAALLLPPGAVISGRSAAHLWGVEFAGPTDPVEVHASSALRGQPGLVVYRSSLDRDEVTTHRGIPTCTPLRTAWEIARRMPVIDAVGWIDALARRRHLTRVQLRAHAERHRGDYWARQAEATLRLCDPRAESPPESRLRVSLVLAGLPVPIPQFQVIVDGFFVARVDLAWPDLMLAVEYDGQWHADRDQLARDRERIRNLNAAGWYIYPVTRNDMRDIATLVTNIAALIDRRRRARSAVVRRYGGFPEG